MTSRMECRVAEMLAEHTAAPGAAMLERLRWTRRNFGRDVASEAARLALVALLDHVREVDGDAAADVLAAHGVELARGRSEPYTDVGCPDPEEVGRLALAVSGRMLADLHGVQDRYSGPVAVACAIACATNAAGLVLDGTGASAVDPLLSMIDGAMRLRQDRPRPRVEVG